MDVGGWTGSMPRRFVELTFHIASMSHVYGIGRRCVICLLIFSCIYHGMAGDRVERAACVPASQYGEYAESLRASGSEAGDRRSRESLAQIKCRAWRSTGRQRRELDRMGRSVARSVQTSSACSVQHSQRRKVNRYLSWPRTKSASAPLTTTVALFLSRAGGQRGERFVYTARGSLGLPCCGLHCPSASGRCGTLCLGQARIAAVTQFASRRELADQSSAHSEPSRARLPSFPCHPTERCEIPALAGRYTICQFPASPPPTLSLALLLCCFFPSLYLDINNGCGNFDLSRLDVDPVTRTPTSYPCRLTTRRIPLEIATAACSPARSRAQSAPPSSS